MSDFPPAYIPKEFEDDIYEAWESSGLFNPDKNKEFRIKNLESGQQPKFKIQDSAFSIVLPPPNVTGTLHLGHASMLAIEDIMVRYHRMKGDDTVWIPGTDHAAIATQNVVEKKLWKEKQKTRHDLGRKAFLKKVEEFVNESKDTIHRQMRKMGASLDWSREAYTLDAPRELAVRTVFTMMYDDGLIYRGNRIVNWCTRCKSTLADDEVTYKEEKTKFYYLKYGPVVIGTARPETKFLDKVIVVHPTDERYQQYVGKALDVEWIEGSVKASVIADAVADPTLGTGAMTITPAHSFEDFALAQKYGFEIHQIINEEGKLTDAAGSMAGMEVAKAREKVVERLQEKGLVDRIDENYTHNLSVCYRCDTPIEPLVSKQWFINVNKAVNVRGKKLQKTVGAKQASLKEMSAAVVRKGAIKIIPERFDKTYFHWMDNLRDWCISRQIWFGHRIPVWYCKKVVRRKSSDISPTDHVRLTTDDLLLEICPPIVSVEAPTQCPNCGNKKLEQDPDTLDTWFSSGLWTFSTLGWPGDVVSHKTSDVSSTDYLRLTTDDLTRFHPTSVLETGYDILFFWVARMILMTTYVLGEVPFETVYLHGLVRDDQGRKMSKSLGNAIDPLIVSEKYGTDAVRLSLVVGTTPGNDVKLSEKKIEGYRNFVNKLWNIARFVTTQSSDVSRKTSELTTYDLPLTTLPDRWILSRMQRVIQSVTEDIEVYRYSQAAETLRAFTWDEVADWYIETAKYQVLGIEYKASTVNTLYQILYTLLKLWHPFTPFVTEAIWQKTSGLRRKTSGRATDDLRLTTDDPLIITPWPVVDKKLIDKKAEKEFAVLEDAITSVRTIRNAYEITPTTTVSVSIVTKYAKVIGANAELVERLARCTLTIDKKKPSGRLSAHPKTAGLWVGVDVGTMNASEQQLRVQKSISELNKHIISLSTSLENKEFVSNAPADVIAARRQMLSDQRERLQELELEMTELQSLSASS